LCRSAASTADESFHVAYHDICRPDLTRSAYLSRDDLHDEISDVHRQDGAGFVVEDAIPYFLPAAAIDNDGVIIKLAEWLKIHLGHAIGAERVEISTKADQAIFESDWRVLAVERDK